MWISGAPYSSPSSSWISFLPIQLSFALRQLDCLGLGNVDMRYTHHSFLPAMSISRSVTTLVLGECRFPTFNSLARLLASCISLASLSLMQLEVPPPTPHIPLIYNSRIKVIHLKEFAIDTFPGLLGLLRWVAPLWSRSPQIATIVLSWTSNAPHDIVQSLNSLLFCATGLRQLYLSMEAVPLKDISSLSLANNVALESLEITLVSGSSIIPHSQFISHLISTISSPQLEVVRTIMPLPRVQDFGAIPWSSIDSSFRDNSNANGFQKLRAVEFALCQSEDPEPYWVRVLDIPAEEREKIVEPGEGISAPFIARANDTFPTSMPYLWNRDIIHFL